MKKTRNELISQLVTELPSGPKPLQVAKYVSLWLLVSWSVVLLAIWLTGALRPNVEEQLITNPRFLLESILGLAAIFMLCLVAIRSSIPAGLGRSFVVVSVGIALLWAMNYVVGLYLPTMEASMLGKRPHCVWETFFYSLPPLFFGFWLVKRSYVLNWPATGLALGLAAGLIPAWLMQLACMYEAKHILIMHVGPSLVVCCLGGLIGWWLQQRLAKAKA